MFSELVMGDDGVPRCPWGNAPTERDYHDTEWGREVRSDDALFERLSLEAFQSGLSWSIILKKRENFRAAFSQFDPAVVAEYGIGDIERLIADAGIVRNRAKIEATISNARAVLGLDRALSDLLWSFAPEPQEPPRTSAEIRSTCSESVAMARELKARGFKFVGPTTAYALMQAVGMVDDHLLGCVARHRAD